MEPRLAGSRPPISLSRVDLPAPDAPDTKMNSPALTRKLISARILRPRPYDLKTCWNSIMAAGEDEAAIVPRSDPDDGCIFFRPFFSVNPSRDFPHVLEYAESLPSSRCFIRPPTVPPGFPYRRER